MEKEPRRLTRKTIFQYAAFGLLDLFTGSLLPHKAEAGYGNCSLCSCPGFIGSGYTCGRGGCAHHYDSHW